jgi:hypothetical protein
MEENEVSLTLREINAKLNAGKQRRYEDKSEGLPLLDFNHVYRIGRHRFAVDNFTRTPDGDFDISVICLHCKNIVINGRSSAIGDIMAAMKRGANES